MEKNMKIALIVGYVAMLIVGLTFIYHVREHWQMTTMALIFVGYLIASSIIFEERLEKLRRDKQYYLFPEYFFIAIDRGYISKHPRDYSGYLRWIGPYQDCLEVMEMEGGGVIVDQDWTIVKKKI